MHTTQQIIENQGKFRNEIFHFLLLEISDAKKELREIRSNDEFILKEKEKLLKKFKKTNTLESIKKYFFLSNKRDEKFYVWWDEIQQETLILEYGKK
jgi:hypothetical protein